MADYPDLASPRSAACTAQLAGRARTGIRSRWRAGAARQPDLDGYSRDLDGCPVTARPSVTMVTDVAAREHRGGLPESCHGR
jgi:hypothetical protein